MLFKHLAWGDSVDLWYQSHSMIFGLIGAVLFTVAIRLIVRRRAIETTHEVVVREPIVLASFFFVASGLLAIVVLSSRTTQSFDSHALDHHLSDYLASGSLLFLCAVGIAIFVSMASNVHAFDKSGVQATFLWKCRVLRWEGLRSARSPNRSYVLLEWDDGTKIIVSDSMIQGRRAIEIALEAIERSRIPSEAMARARIELERFVASE